MKKLNIYLFTVILVLPVFFSSCLKESTEELTNTFNVYANTIISSPDNGEVVVSNTLYTFNMEWVSRIGSVNTSNLIINNTSYDIVTSSSEFKSNSNGEIFFPNMAGIVNSNMSLSLNNADFMMVYPYQEGQSGYYYCTDPAAEYTFVLNPNSPNYRRVLAKFNIGDLYKVNTFPEDVCFVGNTETHYNMQGETVYANPQGILYRVITDFENASATMLMYRAKFSDNIREPLKEVILIEGLDLAITESGIEISGADITPSVYEAEAFTPNPSYVFNNLVFRTTNDYYTTCEISFEVAGMYYGEFKGSYISSPYIAN